MISTFFDQRLTQSGAMADYALEFPTLNWRSSKDNSDSDVYIIISMLLFNGADEFKCGIVKTVMILSLLNYLFYFFLLYFLNIDYLIFLWCYLIRMKLDQL